MSATNEKRADIKTFIEVVDYLNSVVRALNQQFTAGFSIVERFSRTRSQYGLKSVYNSAEQDFYFDLRPLLVTDWSRDQRLRTRDALRVIQKIAAEIREEMQELEELDDKHALPRGLKVLEEESESLMLWGVHGGRSRA